MSEPLTIAPDIRFVILGQPVTQGSKKSMPIYRNGKPVMKDGRVLTRVINALPGLAQWRQEVVQEARKHYDGDLFIGAIRLELVFSRPRPKGHFGTGRNAGKLKASAPRFPTSRPDTLKLGRAIEDALTGVIWRDDSQVVQHVIEKRYGTFYSVSVWIRPLEQTVVEVEQAF
ncbi:hypothetical protein LCGC14_2159590 [marine sediment metagenome]|uniref:Uncharacterized protein n=1 Tax=marine sediment metagenome TaxID=412755 RepID=A0A0F9G623_9ZZZZ